MPLTLFLVRHGETLFNRRGLMQGWVDSPLTEAGVEQARHAAEQLRDRPLVAAYSSTSGRAVDTAEHILEPHSEVHLTTSKDLRELHFGDSEALPNDDVWREVDVEVFFRDLMTGSGSGLAGGESGAEYRERVQRAFSTVVEAHVDDGGEVLVVGHGVTLATYLWSVGWETPGGAAERQHLDCAGSGRRRSSAAGGRRSPRAGRGRLTESAAWVLRRSDSVRQPHRARPSPGAGRSTPYPAGRAASAAGCSSAPRARSPRVSP
jgi:2,3-bisphosphoglycerate-dependent phosphoglycerate mutase